MNLVTVLQRDIGRLVETYDLSLLATLQALRSPALGSLDPDSRQSMLFDGALGADNIGAEIVLDAEGHVIYASTTARPRMPALPTASISSATATTRRSAST